MKGAILERHLLAAFQFCVREKKKLNLRLQTTEISGYLVIAWPNSTHIHATPFEV